MQRVVVLGASPHSDRYSYKAIAALLSHGYDVVPVHPRGGSILGLSVRTSLSEVPLPVDTLSLYVGGDKVAACSDEILALKPSRVIFNPGTENRDVQDRLGAERISVVVGCTLVMLATGQF